MGGYQRDGEGQGQDIGQQMNEARKQYLTVVFVILGFSFSLVVSQIRSEMIAANLNQVLRENNQIITKTKEDVSENKERIEELAKRLQLITDK